MSWPRTTVWVIGILLVLAATAFFFQAANEEESVTYPSIDSYEPSGFGALAELLRADGYTVLVSKESNPTLGPKDIPVIVDRGSNGLSPTQTSQSGEEEREWGHDDDSARLEASLRSHLSKGGTALLIGCPKDWRDANDKRRISAVQPVAGDDRDFKVSLSHVQDSKSGQEDSKLSNALADVFEAIYEEVPLEGGKTSFNVVEVSKYKGGTFFNIQDGIFLTNRFITKSDDAAFALSVFRKLVPKTSRLVFAESAFGNTNPYSLPEAIGPFTRVAKFQIYILVALLLLSGSYRFGLPIISRVKERGVREMVDAMGADLARVANPVFSLGLLIEDSYDRVRIALKLPVGISKTELREQMPETLEKAILDAERQMDQPNPLFFQRRSFGYQNLELAKILEAEVTALEQDTRRRRVG